MLICVYMTACRALWAEACLWACCSRRSCEPAAAVLHHTPLLKHTFSRGHSWHSRAVMRTCWGRPCHVAGKHARPSSTIRHTTHTVAAAAAGSTATKPPHVSSPPAAPTASKPHQEPQQQDASGSKALLAVSSWLEAVLPQAYPPPQQQWQPADILPDPALFSFITQVAALRDQARNVHKDLWVCVVGSYVAEGMLPNRLGLLNSVASLRDESGAGSHVWARWHRAEVAKANRHRALLRQYMYLTGALDMGAVERSVQASIGAGVVNEAGEEPCQLLLRLAFQECLLRLIYTNLSRLAAYHGAATLSNVCAAIAQDKAASARLYCQAAALLFELEPEAAVVAFGQVMQRGVVLLNACMEDWWHAAANKRVVSSTSSKMRLGRAASTSPSNSSSSSSKASGRGVARGALGAGISGAVPQGSAPDSSSSSGSSGAAHSEPPSEPGPSTRVEATPIARNVFRSRSARGGVGDSTTTSSVSPATTTSNSSSSNGGLAAARRRALAGVGLARSADDSTTTSGSSSRGPPAASDPPLGSPSPAAGGQQPPGGQASPASSPDASPGSPAVSSVPVGPRTSPLYCDFMAVADGVGVYTPNDYAAILEYLCDLWQVQALPVSSPAAKAAQQQLAAQPGALRRLSELQLEQRLMERRVGRSPPISFSWVHGRDVPL